MVDNGIELNKSEASISRRGRSVIEFYCDVLETSSLHGVHWYHS